MLSTPSSHAALLHRVSARSTSLASCHPLTLLRTLMRHHDLLWQLMRRDIAARYRGAYLGRIWAFAVPILTLAVYTVVFGTIFQRPASLEDGVGAYALSLFCGFLPWWLFAETAGSAPQLILGRQSFVKKLNFPLEVLPVVHVGVSLFNSLAALAIFLVALAVEGVPFHATLLWLPLLYAILALWALGATYLLSAVGVFLRDLGHAVGVLLQLWFFATPIVYSLDMVPPRLIFWLRLNPMTGVVDAFRQVAYYGHAPDLYILGILAGLGLTLMWLGYLMFMLTRRVFADVI